MSRSAGLIPVTVIGGYLGAGKTTLLNHILKSAASGETPERIAVLVNDFGEINIDAALVESNDGETMSLANGCICCSMVDGLTAAFDAMLELDPRPDRIVIEASGVADPAGVAAFAHSPGLHHDATVVVVDTETIRSTVDDGYVGATATAQIAAADIIVANKVDLASATDVDVEATIAWLGQRAPNAVVVEATDAVVAPELLFGHRADDGSARVSPLQTAPEVHGGGTADDVFESWTLTRDRPIPRAAVERWLVALPDRVVRAKGVVWTTERPDRQLIVHRVGRRTQCRIGPPWDGEPSTSIAVIALR